MVVGHDIAGHNFAAAIILYRPNSVQIVSETMTGDSMNGSLGCF